MTTSTDRDYGRDQTAATSTIFTKTMALLTAAMASMGVGTVLGTLVPPAMVGSFFWVSLVLYLGSILLFAFRKPEWSTGTKVSLLVFASLSVGLFIGPVIGMFAQAVGLKVVLAIFLGCAGVMALCGLAVKVFHWVRFYRMGTFLFWATLGLVAVSLFALAFTGGMSAVVGLAYSLIGIGIFVAYFLVGFSMLAHEQENSWDAAADLAFFLLMAYVNLVLKVIEFICYLAAFLGEASGS
ncbi:MAG: Bax inhibitor-1/YccA family protein [Candidatus Melainabacteria bacterium]|nr:MAG: Bax inhibitor-1/YccA family protein [Candidatus Melainabacteria bacterium]